MCFESAKAPHAVRLPYELSSPLILHAHIAMHYLSMK